MKKCIYSLPFLFFFLSSQLLNAAATETNENETVVQDNKTDENTNVETEEPEMLRLRKSYFHAALAQNPKALESSVNEAYNIFLENVKLLQTFTYEEITQILEADTKVHEILAQKYNINHKRFERDFVGGVSGTGAGIITGHSFNVLSPCCSLSLLGTTKAWLLLGASGLGCCIGLGAVEYYRYFVNSKYEEVPREIFATESSEEEINILKKDEVFAISFSQFDVLCGYSKLDNETTEQMKHKTNGNSTAQ